MFMKTPINKIVAIQKNTQGVQIEQDKDDTDSK